MTEAIPAAFGAPSGLNLLVGASGGYAVPSGCSRGVTLAGAQLFYWGSARAGAGTTRPGKS